MSEILEQLLPGHPVLTLPAWDCLPYDRVSPNGVTIAARMTTLSTHRQWRRARAPSC